MRGSIPRGEFEIGAPRMAWRTWTPDSARVWGAWMTGPNNGVVLGAITAFCWTPAETPVPVEEQLPISAITHRERVIRVNLAVRVVRFPMAGMVAVVVRVINGWPVVKGIRRKPRVWWEQRNS